MRAPAVAVALLDDVERDASRARALLAQELDELTAAQSHAVDWSVSLAWSVGRVEGRDRELLERTLALL
jgi:hypothetical protein